MAVSSVRARSAFLVVLLSGLLAGVACRPSFNADDFIANTLGGPEGEIRSNLSASLSENEKTAVAHYFAALQPLVANTLRLFDDEGALRTETRASGDEVATSYQKLAERAHQLSDQAGQLSAPPLLSPAQEEMAAADQAYAAAVADYAAAYAKFDIPTLQRLDPELDAAQRRILDSFQRIEKESSPLFQPGKGVKLSRQG